jgi:transposase
LAGFSADTDVAADESENSKPAKAPTGGPLPEPATSAPRVGDSKPAKAPLGSERAEETSAAAAEGGSRSGCARYREKIEAKLEAGLSAQRIFQDLREETGFTGSYYSVRRYVRKLGRRRSLPFRRLEQPPGEEAQVDFGSGAPVLAAEGRKKRTHVFRVVLSHSRKAYSEVVYRQTTEAFLSCLENAFREFNGVPKTLVIDNLRAAVKQADWFDPELNRRLEAFCEHYGVVILPTRPRMPRHKGKVERGVDYVQENALKGRVFESLQAENAFLSQWESSTADTRLHGTTRQQVGKLFREVEQPALQKLPAEPFPFFQEQERKVHRDGHVEVDKAYYSVPPEYVSRQVSVRFRFFPRPVLWCPFSAFLQDGVELVVADGVDQPFLAPLFQFVSDVLPPFGSDADGPGHALSPVSEGLPYGGLDRVADPQVVQVVSLDLIQVEHRVPPHEEDVPFLFLAFGVFLGLGELGPEDDVRPPLARQHIVRPLHHMPAQLLPLVPRSPILALKLVPHGGNGQN